MRRRLSIPALIPVFLLFVAATSCAPPRAGRHDVVLISIDTLRADRLGAYGYDRATSPRLDALAADGVVFENVIAESPWTLPSHVTMLTGMHPLSHDVQLPDQAAPASLPLLTEILAEDGYRTFGFTSGGYMRAEHGFGRGFDVFDSSEAPFREKARAAAEAVDSVGPDERFFLFLHTFDVHCPYDPSPGFAGTFESPGTEPIETKRRCGNPFYNGAEGISDAQIRYVSDRYDDGILEADTTIGWFVERLGARLDEAIVIVTSDHGEEFREHGQVGHEATLHGEVLRIPWILRAPGIRPQRVPDLVGLSDVMPTVLELAGIEVPGGLEGRSQAGRVTGAVASASSGTVAEGRVSVNRWKRPLRSVVTPRWHLIEDRETDEIRLYALATDPTEKRDVSDAHADDVAALRRILDAREFGSSPAEPSTIPEPTADQLEQLRALGYVE